MRSTIDVKAHKSVRFTGVFVDALYFSPVYAPVETSWRSEIAM